MTKLELNQMEDIQGQGFWGGLACGLAIVAVAAAYTNPITGTAAAMGTGFVTGALTGTCAGLLSEGL